ncbi:MAG: hypothetical protein ABEK04_04815 [Candidatus Nanohalobium sp.]
MTSTKYIDYDQVQEDFQKLHKFIEEELGVSGYQEMMLLLNYARQNLQPKKAEVSGGESPSYVG